MSREDDYRAARALAIEELKTCDIERCCVRAKFETKNKRQ